MPEPGAHDQTVVVVVVHVDVRKGYALARANGKQYRIVRKKLLKQDLPHVGQQLTIRLGIDQQGEYVAAYDLTPLPEGLDPQVAGLARALGENAPKAIAQLAVVVRLLPYATVMALVDDVRRVEGGGGVWRPGELRRVTPGGHFFRLVREQLSPEQRLLLQSAGDAGAGDAK
jgi:hypothetical protein